MAQANTITVNDRATPTPVAHNFEPREVESGAATFVESNSVPIGEKRLTIRWRQAPNRQFYQRVSLFVPILVTETVNGVSVPTVPRNAYVDCTFRFDEKSTEQERADAVGMFANALASAQTVVNSTVVKLQGIW